MNDFQEKKQTQDIQQFDENRTLSVNELMQTVGIHTNKKASIEEMNDSIISPVNKMWDSFFLSNERADDDFLAERETPNQPERETLENWVK